MSCGQPGLSKFCTKCSTDLPVGDFHNNKNRPDGLAIYCKKCCNGYYQQNIESKQAKRRQWHLDHPARSAEYHRQYYENNKDRLNGHARDYRIRLRTQVIAGYGGKCKCCGISTYEFLAVDHVHGGGNKHRKEQNYKAHIFHRWLIDNNFPPEFQLLCHNCNLAKGFYGRCPHEKA